MMRWITVATVRLIHWTDHPSLVGRSTRVALSFSFIAGDEANRHRQRWRRSSYHLVSCGWVWYVYSIAHNITYD